MRIEYCTKDSTVVVDDDSQSASENNAAASAPILDDGCSGANLSELVDYLKYLQSAPSPNSEWAKHNTATTMSDNNGGVIYF